MAHRVHAIDEEIRKCMSQLSSMATTFAPIFKERTEVVDTNDSSGWFVNWAGYVTGTCIEETITGTPIYFKTVHEEGLGQRAVESKMFKDWITKACTKYVVNAVVIQSVDAFTPAKLGFIKFKARVIAKDYTKPPSIVFMRGGSVAILIVIKCDNGKFYSVLTKQHRVAIGGPLFEIPAGMLDGNGDCTYVAAKELEEETGIAISKGDPNMVDLTAMMYGAETPGVYPSAGACDEYMRIFLYTTSMTYEKIQEIDKKKTGVAEEGEVITVVVVPFNELARKAPDMKTLSALALYSAMQTASMTPSQKIPHNARPKTGLRHGADEVLHDDSYFVDGPDDVRYRPRQ